MGKFLYITLAVVMVSWIWKKCNQQDKRLQEQTKRKNYIEIKSNPNLPKPQQKIMNQQNQLKLIRNIQLNQQNNRQIRANHRQTSRNSESCNQNLTKQYQSASKNITNKVNVKNRSYQLTNEDAKQLSKLGFQEGDQKYSVEECRRQMQKQLHKLNTQYKYSFKFKEKPQAVRGKKMTRTIYLVFQCENCRENRWTTIGGTFQITFQYTIHQSLLVYHLQIFKTQCRKCMNYMVPKTYKTQMQAMKIFFSSIITNIIENKPPPQKPEKYYIRDNHWHKKQWCQACQLGRCTTQNRK